MLFLFLFAALEVFVFDADIIVVVVLSSCSYRVEDMLGTIGIMTIVSRTVYHQRRSRRFGAGKRAVRDARAAALRLEMINSSRLKQHFKGSSSDRFVFFLSLSFRVC